MCLLPLKSNSLIFFDLIISVFFFPSLLLLLLVSRSLSHLVIKRNYGNARSSLAKEKKNTIEVGLLSTDLDRVAVAQG